jgi:hypothetical protein
MEDQSFVGGSHFGHLAEMTEMASPTPKPPRGGPSRNKCGTVRAEQQAWWNGPVPALAPSVSINVTARAKEARFLLTGGRWRHRMLPGQAASRDYLAAVFRRG